MEGDATKEVITAIKLEYPGAIVSHAGLERCFRAKHSVKRETTLLNVSQGMGKRVPEVPYDHIRKHHNLVLFADVLTSSVTDGEYASFQEQINMNLIRNAIVFQGANGVEYSTWHISEDARNVGSPSTVDSNGLNVGSDVVGYEAPYDNWYIGYGSKENGYIGAVTDMWLIKSIDIQDNNNGTSRITFIFEYITPWEKIQDKIDDILGA